jgi:hypothetical protein
MKKQKKGDEPHWLDPKNDARTPYTDEEIDMLGEGFTEDHPEHFQVLKEKDGPNTARGILRNEFKARDPNRKITNRRGMMN